MSPLLNIWKLFRKLRKKHQRVPTQTFPQVSGIFENLRESSEVFGNLRKNRKMSHGAQDDLPAFKFFFMESSEIIGSLRMSSNVFGCLRMSSEIYESLRKNRKMWGSSQNDLPTLENF